MFLQIQDYFTNNYPAYLKAIFEHLSISLEALVIAMIIAIPLGYYCSQLPQMKKYIVFFSQGIRVIPSLAVLFILIPIIGVGKFPALIALSFLAIPPLLINTVVGFTEISPVLIETGLGLGMNNSQILKKVLFPLAFPYILNGIKLALVEIIASATLAAYIGAGGLGSLILTGLGLYRLDLLIIGGGTVALISLITILLFDYLLKEGND